jgi:hypothetical protein
MYMAQLNLNVTRELEQDLARLMKARGIRAKSEAIRTAVHEATLRLGPATEPTDFSSWIGLAKGPRARRKRFRSEDDLWEK